MHKDKNEIFLFWKKLVIDDNNIVLEIHIINLNIYFVVRFLITKKVKLNPQVIFHLFIFTKYGVLANMKI